MIDGLLSHTFLRQIATAPIIVLLRPLILETKDHIQAQTLGIRSQQRLQRLAETSRRYGGKIDNVKWTRWPLSGELSRTRGC